MSHDHRNVRSLGPKRLQAAQNPFLTRPARQRRARGRDQIGEVIEHIMGMIRSGALVPGDRLHSEIRLAEALGISRSAVTKAYARLEAYGLIRSVPQSGTYLAQIGSEALTELLSNALETDAMTVDPGDIDFLFHLRALVEETVALWVIETADDESLERLARKSEAVKQRILNGGGGIEDDLTFHMELADLSGKAFFKSLLFFITLPMVQAYREMEAKKKRGDVKTRWRNSMEEHAEIVAAICARDPERTRKAIRHHFENSINFRY